MPLYLLFLILAIVVALNAERIDRVIQAHGKLKWAVCSPCILLAVSVTIMVKIAL